MRKKLAIAWLILLSLAVAGLFYRMEWQYGLPTPLPEHYQAVERGTSVRLPSAAAALLQQRNKPLFLHFFNPDCPCSRFNMPQFRALVQQYGDRVNFAIVVMSPKTFTAAQLQEKFKLPHLVPVLQDSAMATACGVYSTPQAVLIDRDSRLYFRGNYNRSRYCSDQKTGFARQALDGLLTGNYSLTFSPLALKAYGCQLPTCNQ
jgi:Iodothyronine deiodinase